MHTLARIVYPYHGYFYRILRIRVPNGGKILVPSTWTKLLLMKNTHIWGFTRLLSTLASMYYPPLQVCTITSLLYYDINKDITNSFYYVVPIL